MENVDFAARVRWVEEGAIAVVEMEGEIDLATLPEFKAVLIDASEADRAIIIDLSKVTYMDSSGFSTLLESNRLLRPLGIEMFLVGCNANIGRMLEITRLNTIFRILPMVEDAQKEVGEAPTAVVAA